MSISYQVIFIVATLVDVQLPWLARASKKSLEETLADCKFIRRAESEGVLVAYTMTLAYTAVGVERYWLVDGCILVVVANSGGTQAHGCAGAHRFALHRPVLAPSHTSTVEVIAF